MRFGEIAQAVIAQIFGGMLKRAALLAVFALTSLVAIYHFTAAATMALELRFGPIDARLMIGGAFAVLAMGAIAMWFLQAKQRGSGPEVDGVVVSPHTAQIAMLIEAALAGFSSTTKQRRPRR